MSNKGWFSAGSFLASNKLAYYRWHLAADNMRAIFPSKEQWRKWSLPSKLTALGVCVGILGIIITVALFVISNQHGGKAPERRSRSKPPFRVTYFNIGGHAIDFLIKGRVDKKWETRLAGQPFIVPNGVLKEIKYLIKNFSYEIKGDVLLDVMTTNNRINLNIQGRKLLSFLGTDGRPGKQSIGSPLTESTLIDNIVSTIELTENWNLCWNSYRIDDKPRIRRGTIDAGYFILWKFSDRAEFLKFFDQKRQYPDKTIEFYKYVTREYTPPHFFVTKFMYIDCPGYMELRLEPRLSQLRVAVVENISAGPLNIGPLFIKENRSSYLRTCSDDKNTLGGQQAVKTPVFPQKILKPGEKLLIPLQICFRQDKEALEEYSRQYLTTPPKELEMIGETEYIAIAAGVNQNYEQQIYRMRSLTFSKLLSKTNTDMLLGTEYIYGPSIQIERIEVDNIVYPFRDYDPEKLVMQSGDEQGSCPYIYTYSREAKIWISEGHVLYGNSSKQKEGFDYIQLKRFDGRVQIRENDPEVSYIDLVYIKAKRKDGSEVVILPKDGVLEIEDGNYLILKKGEKLEVNFVLPEDMAAGNFSLVVKGYYIPYVRNKHSRNELQ